MFLPDAGVTDGRVDGVAVLHFRGDVHGDGGPGDGAVASDLEFVACGERDGYSAVQQILADTGVIFLPAGIRERSNIVEDQAVALGVELGGVVRIAGTPGDAIAVD